MFFKINIRLLGLSLIAMVMTLTPLTGVLANNITGKELVLLSYTDNRSVGSTLPVKHVEKGNISYSLTDRLKSNNLPSTFQNQNFIAFVGSMEALIYTKVSIYIESQYKHSRFDKLKIRFVKFDAITSDKLRARLSLEDLNAVSNYVRVDFDHDNYTVIVTMYWSSKVMWEDFLKYHNLSKSNYSAPVYSYEDYSDALNDLSNMATIEDFRDSRFYGNSLHMIAWLEQRLVPFLRDNTNSFSLIEAMAWQEHLKQTTHAFNNRMSLPVGTLFGGGGRVRYDREIRNQILSIF